MSQLLFFSTSNWSRKWSKNFKVPIAPKFFLCPDEWLCHAEQNGEKNLFLVETGICYEFSKSGLSAPRPGERKTGTSDVKPGH